MTYDSVNYDVQACTVCFTTMSTANQEETMGQRLTRQMEVKNLSQSDVARMIGVSRMTVSQWCRDISEPGNESLLKLGELFFDGDVLYLVFGAKRQPEGGFPTSPTPRTGGVDSSASGTFVSPFRRKRKT